MSLRRPTSPRALPLPPAAARERSTPSTPTSLTAWRSEGHRMKLQFLLLIVLCSVGAAQTPDGINAPASRTVTLTADEATFTIAVAATLDSTQAQVKQAIENAGLPNPTVV